MTDHFIISSLLSLLVARLSTETSTRALQTLWMLQASLLPLQLPAGPELNFWFMGFHHFSETADSSLSRGMASYTERCPYTANMGILRRPAWAKKLNYFPCLLLLVFNVFCMSKWKWTWTDSHCGQRIDSCWLQWMLEGGPETYPLGTDLHQLFTSCYPTGFRQGFKNFAESVLASQRPHFKACVATER